MRVAAVGTMLTRHDLGVLTGRLAALSLEGIIAIPSIDPRRAPVMLGAAVVAEEALAVSGHDSVTVSESDILDGVDPSLLD